MCGSMRSGMRCRPRRRLHCMWSWLRWNGRRQWCPVLRGLRSGRVHPRDDLQIRRPWWRLQQRQAKARFHLHHHELRPPEPVAVAPSSHVAAFRYHHSALRLRVRLHDLGDFVVAGPAGLLLHDNRPWLHHHPAKNGIASAPADSAADSIPHSSSNSSSNAAAHNAAPSAAAAAHASASPSWPCRPIQLRCWFLVLLGWRQTGLVLRPSSHLRWSTDAAASTS